MTKKWYGQRTWKTVTSMSQRTYQRLHREREGDKEKYFREDSAEESDVQEVRAEFTDENVVTKDEFEIDIWTELYGRYFCQQAICRR